MTQQTRARRVAALAAGALASTTLATVGLAVVTAPAQAAPATGSFNWEISQQFDNHLAQHNLSSNVTEDADGVLSFPAESSSVDPATGAGTVQYDGSVQAGFTNGGATALYWVKLEDPAVTVDAAGEGQITALVSSAVGGFDTAATAARVVVTTFDAASKWSTGAIAATPDWAGVLPPGSEQAIALGITNVQRPVDGKSFAPSFLGQLDPGVRAHFYWSTGSDLKAPSAFTSSYTKVARTVTATPSYANQSVSIKVDGAGFTGTDGNPGDNGVYVGLAPAGGLPATSTQADMDKFAAAQWIPAASIADGKISTTLAATAAVLKQGTAYSVYTWRAHSHSSTSQDTETPVTIDWSKLTVAPTTPVTPVTTSATKVSAVIVKKPTTTKGGKLSIGLKGYGGTPAGKVTVKLTSKGKKAVTRSAKATNGKAVVKLPKLKAGSWRATVVYAGSGKFKPSKISVRFKVKKAKKK